jgi:hypothetical protein
MKLATVMKNIKLTNYFKLGFLAALVLTISACASLKNPDAPVPQNYPHSYQKQLQASQHWAIVADDMSNQIITKLKENKALSKPVYVDVKSNQSDFSQAMNDFMITNLVRKGVKVSKSKAKSTVLDYKVQVIKFNSNRDVLLPSQLKWTTLAGGLVVYRILSDAIDLNPFDQAVITGGALADLWANGGAPKLELVVTASVVIDDLYAIRTTDVYYANEEDKHLYESKKATSKKTSNNPFNDSFYKQIR